MYCVASKSNDISLKYGDITIIFKKAMVRYLGFPNLEFFTFAQYGVRLPS